MGLFSKKFCLADQYALLTDGMPENIALKVMKIPPTEIQDGMVNGKWWRIYKWVYWGGRGGHAIFGFKTWDGKIVEMGKNVKPDDPPPTFFASLINFLAK